MLKTIFTLVRGAAFRAEEEFADRSALLILDQQIRDAAAGIERARRALAIAIAQDEAEGKQLETTLARIADLEERAVAALDGGSDELAAEAAEAIAVMEADRDSIREARATFAREIAGLKATVRKSGQRFAELERGRRIAAAGESVRRLKAGSGLTVPVARLRWRSRKRPCAGCATGSSRTPRPRTPSRRWTSRTRTASLTGSRRRASAGAPARPRRACSSA